MLCFLLSIVTSFGYVLTFWVICDTIKLTEKGRRGIAVPNGAGKSYYYNHYSCLRSICQGANSAGIVFQAPFFCKFYAGNRRFFASPRKEKNMNTKLEDLGILELIALEEQLRDSIADLEGRVSVRTAELREEVTELILYKRALEAAIDAADDQADEEEGTE